MDAANALLEPLGDKPTLSDRDREILEFERQWWKYAGAKETAVREKFDMSSTRYYQVLNALIDKPEALEADPLLVRRLRRLARLSPAAALRAPPGLRARAADASSACSSATGPATSGGSPTPRRW